ncbi:MAG TPA: branched-chain amino acid transaminase [Candidatus Bathyarchaeia archaeon]|nr:branched-chain amino acid transaminase [Candidatus Bathyarchaeia archaeon]
MAMAEGFTDEGKIWYNGAFVDWKEAKVHVLVHGLHYGSGVFEGIRCYATEKGSFIFRLKEHVDRMYRSAEAYEMEIPYTRGEIEEAIKETIRVNGLDACYIRPIAFFGYHHLGLNPTGCPVDCAIAVWPWGAYLGEEAAEGGIRCTFSPWRRIDPNTLPVKSKAVGHYLNSILASLDAKERGFGEAILLDTKGYVAEGPGENVFAVKNGVLYTPEADSSILPGITRASVIELAQDMGYEVVEKRMTKEELLSADEAFFTGTAAEIAPIREIDDVTIGGSKKGAVTSVIQRKFFDVLNAREEKYMKWLEPVYE